MSQVSNAAPEAPRGSACARAGKGRGHGGPRDPAQGAFHNVENRHRLPHSERKPQTRRKKGGGKKGISAFGVHEVRAQTAQLGQRGPALGHPSVHLRVTPNELSA